MEKSCEQCKQQHLGSHNPQRQEDVSACQSCEAVSSTTYQPCSSHALIDISGGQGVTYSSAITQQTCPLCIKSGSSREQASGTTIDWWRTCHHLGDRVQVLGVEADAEVALPVLQLPMRGPTCAFPEAVQLLMPAPERERLHHACRRRRRHHRTVLFRPGSIQQAQT